MHVERENIDKKSNRVDQKEVLKTTADHLFPPCAPNLSAQVQGQASSLTSPAQQGDYQYLA